MSLCNSNCMVFAIFLIVHTLCNQLFLEPSVYSFNSLQECYRDILKMCMKKINDKRKNLINL